MDSQKQPLLGMTLAELKQVVASLGMPSFTAKQIASWMYDKQVAEIDEMTNLSVKNRQLLAERYCIGNSAPVDGQHSVDGVERATEHRCEAVDGSGAVPVHTFGYHAQQ